MLHDALSGILGGALVGLASGALLLFHGRVAGISGIYGGVLSAAHGDVLWRVLFVAGLLTGGLILLAVSPASLAQDFGVHGARGWSVLLLAGFLVGLGTRLGGGCTSGHGVCGVARLSQRSLVATGIFMLTGMITVFIVRHLLGA